MENKRKTEISLLNVLFCLLVIFIHVTSYPVSEYDISYTYYTLTMIPWRLSAFVVQGFILLSGVKLFLTKADTINYKDFFKSRAKNIFLPYLLWFFIYYALFMITAGYKFDIKFITKNLFNGNLVAHFYFIVIILQFYLLTPLWRIIVKKIKGIYIIPVAIIITLIADYIPLMIKNFYYNDRIFTTYIGYWLIGCYIGANYDKFKDFLRKQKLSITLAFTLMLIINTYLSYLGYKQIKFIPYLNTIHTLYCYITIIFLYMLAFKFKECLNSNIIRQIDKSSYLIYLSHIFVIYFVNFLISKTGITSIGASYIIRILLVYPITIYGCILWYKLKKPLF